MKLRIIKSLSVGFLTAALHASANTTNSVPHVYMGSAALALKIGNDLYENLDAKYRKSLEPVPFTLVPMDIPAMAPTETNTHCQIAVSPGFIALINRIAHAKAIDLIERGYFNRYVALLSQDSANGKPPELPNIENARYWSDDVMNDQGGFFNQMMSLTMAINLSHQYLGEFHKYSAQMSGGVVPINNFLTPSEWDKSVKVATQNSLDCAFATAGGTALFEAIGNMPHRPAWANYILPANVDIKKLNKKLARYESEFFRGH
jgi:hypothetical protein